MPNFSHLSSFFRPWKNQRVELKNYFQIYGGGNALLKSPYVQISVALGAALTFFIKPLLPFGQIGVSILPNLIGFSIGGMAIVMSISSAEIFRTLTEKGDPRSFFMKMVVSFLHYILIQVSTLIMCVLSYHNQHIPLNLICAVMLMYCLLLAFSIAMALFQMARIYNAHASLPTIENSPLGHVGEDERL